MKNVICKFGFFLRPLDANTNFVFLGYNLKIILIACAVHTIPYNNKYIKMNARYMFIIVGIYNILRVNKCFLRNYRLFTPSPLSVKQLYTYLRNFSRNFLKFEIKFFLGKRSFYLCIYEPFT